MSKMTLSDIREKLSKIIDRDHPFIEEIKRDDRKGVQQLILAWNKRYDDRKLKEQKFLEMSFYEREARELGYTRIAGIDEVGRGPLAGPVVAACVILPEDCSLIGIDDSKKLSESKRNIFYEQIMCEAVAVAVGIIGQEEIDKLNIYEATKKAMLTAVQQLKEPADYLLIDAMPLETPYPSRSIVKGDANSISIAAASIIAKVTRDRIMKKIDTEYPQYFFAKNMGYGTSEHLRALHDYGVTPYHRRSFEPIKSMVKQ